jgi:hypothetical protein
VADVVVLGGIRHSGQRATVPGRPPVLGTYGSDTEPLPVIKL